MSEDFRQELLAAFAIEHREHLDAIRAALDAAERGGPVDGRDIFRRAHSLKGAARAVDLPAVEEVAHRLETLLARIAEGQVPLAGAVPAVQLALDGIEGLVAAQAAGDDAPVAPPEVLAALERALDPAPAAPPAAEPGAAAPPGVGAPGPADVAASPTAPAVVAAPPPTAPAAPPPTAAPPVAAPPGQAASPAGPPSVPAAPQPVPAAVRDPAPAEAASAPPVAAPAAAPAAPEYLRVEAGRVAALSGTMHELSGFLQRQDANGAALRLLERDLRTLRRSWDALRDGGGGTALPPAQAQGFGAELDALLRRAAALSRQGRADGWNTDQAMRRLREGVEELFLVPAESVLGALGRAVRDLARGEGREVAVRLEGLDIQADRRVLQALKDPVLHLLRNAVGHGAQPEAERLAQGKPARAEVGLSLAQGRDGLELRVFDDGPGPDLGRIEAVAVRRGLLPARAPGAPPPAADHLLDLVFEPGFSTAGAVDRLSGRGIGLSVVAEAARALRGTVRLRPRPAPPGGTEIPQGGTGVPQGGTGVRQGGTEVVITVPFFTARQSLLLVEAEGQVFGLPAPGVERILRLPVAALESVGGRPVARIELGSSRVMAPVVGLATLLGRPGGKAPIEAGYMNAILLRRGDRRCVVAVSALRDVRTLLVNEVDVPGLDTELVAGAALLEDEGIALVLRPESLVERWMRDEARLGAQALAGLPGAEAATVRPAATVLVVDDSITTRTLEKSILEASGYRVVLAVDGQDALDRLRGGDLPVDLVIADVEMPRLDGFGLLEAMKADPRLNRLPVIMMTSRADPADVQRGLELGADAYLNKRTFDQGELLATVGQVL
ncbi:response regulator [Roseomonas sp. BN140053]|uniref:hybrid sensor histidine kinase/response regulator n=1 Tax=Roseomonas sp. BN140053 TaxID=3391898 RepID=UPI0039E8A0C8